MVSKQKEIKKKTFREPPEAIISEKKAYELFSDKSEYNENNYDSEKDEEFLIKFDEELEFKNNIKGVDLAFLIDTTGSMNPYLKAIKVFIRKIIRDAIRCMTQYTFDSDNMLRIGLVCYRDHPPQGKSYGNFNLDFTHEHANFKEILKSLNAKGGGDDAEAVLDGLDDAINTLTWREDSEKFIFHILDAPPHGEQFGSSKDGFPGGCPCGKDTETLLLQLREKNIDYTLIKLDPSVNKMIEVFSRYIEVDVLTLDIERLKGKSSDQSG